jgi:hypothetical protein
MSDHEVGPSTARPADSATESPRDLGPLGRLVGVFIHPRATFASMVSRPRFLLAFLIVLAAQTAFGFLMVQSGIVRDESIAKLEAQGKDPRQIEAMEAFFNSPAAPVITAVTGMVTFGFGLVAGAALLFFMGNFMQGAHLTFRHYVSVTAFSWLVSLVDHAARVGLILARGSLDVRLGLGNLFGEEIGFAGRALDLATDPLLLWATGISALGVGVFAGKSFGFGVTAALPGFLLGIVFQAIR